MAESVSKVAVIGLGKLGSPMAAVFAKHGFSTTGLDINPELVAAINAGRAPVQEPGLQDTIDAAGKNLRATTDFAEAVNRSEVSFVIVPTPSEADHTFSNRYLADAVTRIGAALKNRSDYHLVVITSTVMPGSTAALAALLEAASSRKLGDDLGLCYSPEFIALGSVIDNMERPDLVLIGESDPRAGATLAEIYARTTRSSPEIHRMNFVNAEICKIALNTYVTTKISYANTIAELCDRLDGADCDVVTAALGADSRVGRKYLRGAIGYGGPCFPRDNKAFAALARQLGASCELAEATDRVNDRQVHRAAAMIDRHADKGDTVAVLGVSYKPDTGVIEGSQGIALAHLLLQSGRKVVLADPEGLNEARTVLGPRVQYAASARDALAAAQVAVIMTPWPQFKPAFGGCGSITVIDFWRLLDPAAVASGVTLIAPGRASAADR